MTDAKAELRPCPACKGGPIIGQTGGEFCIRCEKCELRMLHPDRETLVSAWNTRTPPPAAEVVERVALVNRMYDEYAKHQNPDDCKKVWLEWLQASSAAAVPEGMVLVPVEPTDEMIKRFFAVYHGNQESARLAYRAMIAAAPER